MNDIGEWIKNALGVILAGVDVPATLEYPVGVTITGIVFNQGLHGDIALLIAVPVGGETTGEFVVALLACFKIGIVAIEKCGTALGEIDHGGIVWDEIIPFSGVLWILAQAMGDNLLWQGIAFALFRLFDITKPWPARYYDRKVKNGYGVMMDDVIAALYTAITLTVILVIVYLGSHL